MAKRAPFAKSLCFFHGEPPYVKLLAASPRSATDVRFLIGGLASHDPDLHERNLILLWRTVCPNRNTPSLRRLEI